MLAGWAREVWVSVQIVQGTSEYPRTGLGPVLTIGNFDGVHLGHQTLLNRVIETARELKHPSAVLTFDPAPRDILRPDNDIPRIQSLEDKIQTLGALGIDQVIVEPFTPELGAMSPQWFANEMLVSRLRTSAFVLGWDFRFGRKRAGTVSDLAAWTGLPVEQVSAFKNGTEVVSSSRIRTSVRAGDVETAARLLGRPHRNRGRVIHGHQRGRQIGFPTANISVETPLRPCPAVYVVRCDIGDGRLRPAIANLGRRPTFGSGDVTLEVHLLDFEGDLYGAQVAVDFVGKVREETAFPNVEALKAQIAADCEYARERLA
jgi:riboflavin kinase / FMN adenylyltransferase